MNAQEDVLDFDLISRLGMPDERAPEVRPAGWRPVDTTIVSADCHLSLEEDIWFDRFPAHLKDKAPRVWRDAQGVCQVGWNGVSGLGTTISSVFSRFDSLPGSYNIEARIADLDREGIDKEIVFPNAMLVLVSNTDIQIREWAYRIYNEYMAELQSRAPGRFYGVGFINYWDSERTAASLAELKDLGIRTFMMPMNPGLDASGNRIFYHGDNMGPMWDAIEESGLPVCFHIGENIASGPRSEVTISSLMNFSPFRKTAGELIFGGILDRHPLLRVAFMEAGINWVAAMLQDAESIHAAYHHISDWRLQKDIRSYWRDHMYATFMYDRLGLRLLDEIGAGKVMWASDYPHAEGTFGYGWTAMSEVVNATSQADAKKILGGTAMELFQL